MVQGDTRVVRDGSAKRRGRPDIPLSIGPDTFNAADENTYLANTGYTGSLVAWNSATMLQAGDTIDAVNQRLFIDAPNHTYHHIDFGTWSVKPRAANGRVHDCRFTNTRNRSDSSARYSFDCVDSANSNFLIERCTIDNVAKFSPGWSPVFGRNFTIRRCQLYHGADIIDPNGSDGQQMNVHIKENYFGPMAWWASNAASGIVHPSDNTTHNDCIQWGIGSGLWIERNYINAQISTTVGTGLPGTGSEFGNFGQDYTQAQGEAMRDGSYGPSYGYLNSSIAAVMIVAQASNPPRQLHLLDNILGGGTYTLNGTSLNNLTAGIDDGSEIMRNKVLRNQLITGAALRIRSATIVNMGAGPSSGPGLPGAGINKNYWADTLAEVTRGNA